MITKSAYLKGRQCSKRLWLHTHGVAEPELEPDDVWEERREEGAQVEAEAEKLFPGGRRSAHDFDEDAPGAGGDAGRWETTASGLDTSAPVFQALLQHDDLLAVADILEPREGGWFVWEVKASTYKPDDWPALFDWDLAFQVHVARRSGLTVVGAGGLMLSREYVRGAGEIDPVALLVREDRTAVVEGLQPLVETELREMRQVIRAATAPADLPGARCKGNRTAQGGDRVSACGHIAPDGECGRGLPPNWAGRLPRLSGKKEIHVSSTPNLAIEDLDIDDPVQKWTAKQRWVIKAVKTGEPYIDAAALRAKLALLEWPVTYLDFEFDPGVAVPRFEGCRPYDRIPFQWALAIQNVPGAELGDQQDFLHLDETDPSRPFAEALLAAVPASGSLVAHHASAEITVIRRLAERLGGELGARLEALILRFVDTETIASAGYYHPEQQGSWSIKRLAPALLGRGYDDLEIANGLAAVMAWRQAVRAGGEERERLGRELRAYCGRDAELMHAILERLMALADEA